MPNSFERRTIIPRGRIVGDEIWLADDVRRQAAWNDKIRWTLADWLCQISDNASFASVALISKPAKICP